MECMLSKNISNYWAKPMHIKDTWFVSEKYDGIRAIWTGDSLITRSNRKFTYVPPTFLGKLPKGIPLDGELLVPGKPFSYFSSISIRKDWDPKWDQVVYMVFDTPQPNIPFTKRLVYLKKNLPKCKQIKLVPFCEIANIQFNMEKVHKLYGNIIQKGGEGVMLIKDDSLYEHGKRSKWLLKYKKNIEGECVVIGYVGGNGKYAGFLGALKCKLDNGSVFHIGTGFTDEQRKKYKFNNTIATKGPAVSVTSQDVPKIGDTITYQCLEIIKKSGIPRMPIFKCIRFDIDCAK